MNALRRIIHPRDSMYAPGEIPFSAKAANDDRKPAEHSLIDSWYFLVPMTLIAIAVLVARAMGWVR